MLFLVVSWGILWWRNRAFSGYCSRRCCRWRSGQGVQSAMNKTQGVELEIRKTMVIPSWWYRNKATLVSLRPTCRTGQQWQSGDRFPALNNLRVVRLLTTRPLHFTLWPVINDIMLKFCDELNQLFQFLCEMPYKISARVLLITASISLIAALPFPSV